MNAGLIAKPLMSSLNSIRMRRDASRQSGIRPTADFGLVICQPVGNVLPAHVAVGVTVEHRSELVQCVSDGVCCGHTRAPIQADERPCPCKSPAGQWHSVCGVQQTEACTFVIE